MFGQSVTRYLNYVLRATSNLRSLIASPIEERTAKDIFNKKYYQWSTKEIILDPVLSSIGLIKILRN